MLTFVGASTDVASPTIPTGYQPGDLLLAFSQKNSTNAIPALPANWTSLATNNANVYGFRVAYKIAVANEPVPTFTGASETVILCYRGLAATPIGSSVNLNGANGTSIKLMNITLANQTGDSWVVGFVGTKNNTQPLEGAIPAMTQRASFTGAGEIAVYDTNGGVTSWIGADHPIITSTSIWRSYVVEVVGEPAPVVPVGATSSTLDPVTGTSAGLVANTSATSASLDAVTSSSSSLISLTASLSATLGQVAGSSLGGALPMAGTSTQTLGSVTATSAAQTRIQAQVTATLGSVSSASTGQSRLSASSSNQLGPVTLVATSDLQGLDPVGGNLEANLGSIQVASVARTRLASDLVGILAPVTATSVGQGSQSGSLTTTLGQVVGVQAAVVPIRAVATSTLGDIQSAAVAVQPVDASANLVLGTVSAVSQSGVQVGGVASAVLGAVTSHAQGRRELPTAPVDRTILADVQLRLMVADLEVRFAAADSTNRLA